MRFLITLFAILLNYQAYAFDGAMLGLSANQAISPQNNNQVISWGNVDYDTLGFWSSSQPTRFTIPSGVSKVRLTVSQVYEGNCSGFRQLIILKNRSMPANFGWFRGDTVINATAVCGTTTDIQGVTPIIPVIAGDYFEATGLQTGSASLNLLQSTGTWFSIEVVQ